MPRYLDGWRRRLRQQFNPIRFYLTPEGLAFFYPMYAIAPAAEEKTADQPSNDL